MNVKLRNLVISMSKIAIYTSIFCYTLSMALATESAAQRKHLDEIIYHTEVESGLLLDLFIEIEEKSDFIFAYTDKDLRNKTFSLTRASWTLNDLLKELSVQSEISFRRINETITVKKLNKKEDLPSVQESFTEVKAVITGTVTDEFGGGLPGATVQEKNTLNGTITDFDGFYSLSVSDENAILVFSFVGYQTVEIPINNRTTIDLPLSPDIEALSEVIVVGYGTQEKVNITGSIAEVKGKEIADIPASNVTNSLAGRLPGVIITNPNGEPGNDVSDVSIRGFGPPLFIVDGVQMDFSRIDPNDVASISVLKDASAYVYGARAGNGVFLVTTKRGEITDKPEVEFNAAYGLQGTTVYPEYVNATQYMTLVNEYQPNSYTQDDFDDFANGTRKSTDWYDETFRKTAPMLRTNMNVKGGNESIRYYASYGFMNQESILRSEDTRYNQHNVRANLDINLSKNLELQFDFSHRIQKSEYPGYSIAEITQNVAFSNPTLVPRFPDASLPVYNGFQVGPNYLAEKDVSGYRRNDFRITSGNIGLKYDVPFVEGLSARAFVNLISDHTVSKNWNKNFNYYRYDPISEVYSEVVYRDISEISLLEQFNRTDQLTGQYSLNYERQVGKHKVAGLALFEFIDIQENNFISGRNDFISSAVDQQFAGNKGNETTGGSASETGRVSYVGRFNYSYDERYLLEGTFRYDAIPDFPKDSRWGFFPAVSVGWRLSEEAFLSNSSIVDVLKLRASYGQAGYDGNSSFDYLTGYRFESPVVIGDRINSGLVSKGLANPNITWETMTMINVGVNASIWDKKLWIDIDVFQRDRDGMLGTREASLPSTLGVQLPEENINSQQSRGFELIIGHDATIGDFKYWASGNVSVARAKWINFDEPTFADAATAARLQKSGQEVNRYFGLQALGLFSDATEIGEWPDQVDRSDEDKIELIEPGDIKYLDYNNDGVINDLDVHAIGKGGIPETFFGLQSGLEYKGIDFSMLWQGATDFNVAFTAEAQEPFYNGATPLVMFMDRWTEDNPDPNAKFPRTVGEGGNKNNSKPSTFWMQDGTYLRLKNVTVGYTLPESLLEKMKIQSLRVYASGLNLLTFTEVYPFDPETATGGRGWVYPQQRTVMVGATLSF